MTMSYFASAANAEEPIKARRGRKRIRRLWACRGAAQLSLRVGPAKFCARLGRSSVCGVREMLLAYEVLAAPLDSLGGRGGETRLSYEVELDRVNGTIGG